MKFKLLTYTIFILLTFNIYAQKSELPNWLIGTWTSNYDNGTTYEQWQKVDKNTFNGKIFRIFGADTIIFSTMQIKRINNKIILETFTPFSDDNKPISYDLIEQTSKLWTFETQKDVYPKKINYLQVDATSTQVWTEPTSEDYVCTDFLMKKQ